MNWRQKYQGKGLNVMNWKEVQDSINERTVYAEAEYEVAGSCSDCEKLQSQIRRLSRTCLFLLVNLASVSMGFLALLFLFHQMSK